MIDVHVCLHIVILTTSLGDLSEFIKVTSTGLAVEVPEGDYEMLVGVMHHLLAVRDRQPTTDGMFEPLNQTIELLKTYHEEMPELVHQQLEVCLGSLYSVVTLLLLITGATRAVEQCEEAVGSDETRCSSAAGRRNQQLAT